MRFRVVFLFIAAAMAGCNDASGPSCDRDQVVTLDVVASGHRTLTSVGDTLRLEAIPLGECGDTIRNASIAWSTTNPNVATVTNGLTSATGEGTAVIHASVDAAIDSVTITVDFPVQGAFTVIGLGLVENATTTELWVHGDYAYTGTTNGTLFTWRISENAAPLRVDSLPVGGSVGDVMTSPDGRLGFVALQGFGRGVAILNLDNPARPVLSSTYSTGLENGVHTLWFERINSRDYVFAIENGSSVQGGTHVLDVTNLSAVTEVAHFYGGTSFAHDIYVRDGLAFLNHWNAGLIVLDVGNGVRGGSPSNPVEVSRIAAPLSSVHNVWYWPARKLAFVGEERINGRLQVIDFADITQPRLIAFHEIPGGTPHNYWMDEARGLLFASWYTHGIRVFDVNGTLSGDISGREIASIIPPGPRPSSIWGPQLHRGVVFAADLANGLWALRFLKDGV